MRSMITSDPAATATASAVPIDLPPSDALAAPSPVVVTIDAHGDVTVDGAPVADDQAIHAAVVAAYQATTPRLVIEADASVPFGRVMHVVDLLRSVGLVRVGFRIYKSP